MCEVRCPPARDERRCRVTLYVTVESKLERTFRPQRRSPYRLRPESNAGAALCGSVTAAAQGNNTSSMVTSVQYLLCRGHTDSLLYSDWTVQDKRLFFWSVIKGERVNVSVLFRTPLSSQPSSMSFTITQNLFVGDPTTIIVVQCKDSAVNLQHLQPLLATAQEDGVLGISATYGAGCRLSSIALSTLSQVLVVNISRSSHDVPEDARRRIAKTKSLIQDHLLLNHKFPKYAFMMDEIAVSLYLDFSIRIDDAVDMLSVCATDGRHSPRALMNAMGGETKLQKKNILSLFFDTSRSSKVDASSKVALKAWAACRAATLPHMSSRLISIPRINTKAFPKAVWCLVHLHVAILTCRKNSAFGCPDEHLPERGPFGGFETDRHEERCQGTVHCEERCP